MRLTDVKGKVHDGIFGYDAISNRSGRNNKRTAEIYDSKTNSDWGYQQSAGRVCWIRSCEASLRTAGDREAIRATRRKTLIEGKLENLSDPRVKCVVPISAQAESESYGLTAESWTDASTPAMHITGTRDRSAPDRPGGQFGDASTKVIPFERSPQGGKYLLIIEDATHVSFGGRMGRLRGGADAAGLTKSVSLAFLEAYLKQDVEAKAWLDGEASATWLGSQAKLQRKL